ncbi:hypothetical protein PtA15_3A112 [Puccinia triticina]|uniref:Hydrophobin n=1 Tax=Puccinia triticina TaxID=208348 RepID=A0ABY7CC05_9BASI|nr:uncharacterized protein PtA15_3A112 [Puccinia triticina]WAQ82748.1 hypothetical protein PtA15_3A112 [Puccinia triticina]
MELSKFLLSVLLAIGLQGQASEARGTTSPKIAKACGDGLQILCLTLKKIGGTGRRPSLQAIALSYGTYSNSAHTMFDCTKSANSSPDTDTLVAQCCTAAVKLQLSLPSSSTPPGALPLNIFSDIPPEFYQNTCNAASPA